MPHRRRISVKSSASVEEEIKRFILAKKAKGLADKTLATYQQHFSAISKHLDLGQSIENHEYCRLFRGNMLLTGIKDTMGFKRPLVQIQSLGPTSKA